MNALRPLRMLREAESRHHAEPPLASPSSDDEFLPRSVLHDPEFRARIRREAHLKRNQAIRDALAALPRWIAKKVHG